MNRYAHHSDEELVPLLREGDTIAFGEIYNRYAGGLLRYISRQLNNEPLSKDFLQDIFTNLWRLRDTPIHNLNDFLFRSAKNRIINNFHAQAVRSKYIAEFIHTMKSAQVDNSNEEAQALIDLQADIERKLSSLPERTAQAFRLSRMEHMSIQQIASRMNISTGTVQNYITQALKHLRTNVGEMLALVWWFLRP